MPFRSYLLNGTANPAHFYQNWAELAPRIFFSFLHFNFPLFFLKYETIETHALEFLTHIVLAIGGVTYLPLKGK